MTARRHSWVRPIRLPRAAIVCRWCGVAKSTGVDTPCPGKIRAELRENRLKGNGE